MGSHQAVEYITVSAKNAQRNGVRSGTQRTLQLAIAYGITKKIS
jgi:hypothetical protein